MRHVAAAHEICALEGIAVTDPQAAVQLRTYVYTRLENLNNHKNCAATSSLDKNFYPSVILVLFSRYFARLEYSFYKNSAAATMAVS